MEKDKGGVEQKDAAKENYVKHTVKDSVFSDIFGMKKYLFQLYQTLHPEDQETKEEDLKNFTKVYSEQRMLYGRTKKAILETIRICKDEDVLKEYLESRESEVVDIMLTLFDEEKIMRNHIRSEKEEAAKQAAIQNTVEICQDFDASFSDAVQKLIAKFGLSEADAEDAVQKYWN